MGWRRISDNAMKDGQMLVVRETFDGERDYYGYVGNRLVAVVAAENGGGEAAKRACEVELRVAA